MESELGSTQEQVGAPPQGESIPSGGALGSLSREVMTLLAVVAIFCSLISLLDFRLPVSKLFLGRAPLAPDPALTRTVKLPESDVRGKPIPNGKKLLIYAGSCSSCTARAIDYRKLTVGLEYAAAVIIYSGSSTDVEHGLSDIPERFSVLTDDGRVGNRLMPMVVPRLYVLDEANVVVWSGSVREMPRGVSLEGSIK